MSPSGWEWIIKAAKLSDAKALNDIRCLTRELGLFLGLEDKYALDIKR
jgi:hypothetical protein